MSDRALPPIPRGLKIAAAYLITAGFVGIFFVLFAPLQSPSEFANQGTARKLGSYARELVMSIAFIAAGTGCLFRKDWARKLALLAVPLSAYYAGPALAAGFGGWPPETTVLVTSYALVTLWKSLIFFQLIRRESKLAMVCT